MLTQSWFKPTPMPVENYQLAYMWLLYLPWYYYYYHYDEDGVVKIPLGIRCSQGWDQSAELPPYAPSWTAGSYLLSYCSCALTHCKRTHTTIYTHIHTHKTHTSIHASTQTRPISGDSWKWGQRIFTSLSCLSKSKSVKILWPAMHISYATKATNLIWKLDMIFTSTFSLKLAKVAYSHNNVIMRQLHLLLSQNSLCFSSFFQVLSRLCAWVYSLGHAMPKTALQHAFAACSKELEK